MLKLTRDLLKITGDTKYADYYENTFINAILSSQNPETGMTTYFQPMATGYFKVYSSPYDHFWCCTGSGMENFSKLGDSIYLYNDESLYVNRFTSSKIKWEQKGIEIIQTAHLPSVKFDINGSAKAKIVLRIPEWTSNSTVKINGKEIEYTAKNNLIILENEWNNDTVEYTLPMKITVHKLPDNENAVAFKYGPYVLSANMGTNKMETGVTGVNVTIPMGDETLSDVLVIENNTVEGWLENINENLVKDEIAMLFTLKGTNQRLTFSPHYMQHTSRYGIYFNLNEKGSAK